MKPEVLEGLFPGAHHGTLLRLRVWLLEPLQYGLLMWCSAWSFCSCPLFRWARDTKEALRSIRVVPCS